MSVIKTHFTWTFTIFNQKWKFSCKVCVKCIMTSIVLLHWCSFSLCEKLVSVAMETDNLSLIDDMLTHIDHTPEHILVMLLTTLVDRWVNHISLSLYNLFYCFKASRFQPINTGKTFTVSSYTKHVEYYLNWYIIYLTWTFRLKVFSCSYNEALLRHNMRKLSFQQSMVRVVGCYAITWSVPLTDFGGAAARPTQ